jgi:hypothetical protein
LPGRGGVSKVDVDGQLWQCGLTVDSRWADNSSLNHVSIVGTSFEHDLVDVTVESVVRQVGDFFHAAPVVVFFLRPLAEAVVVVVHVSQDSSATGVQVVARVLL